MGRRIRYHRSLVGEQIAAGRGTRGDTLLTSNTIITIAVVWVLLLVVLGGVGYFIMQNRKFQNEFAPLVEVCRGKWVDASVQTFTGKSPRHCQETELFSKDKKTVKLVGTEISDLSFDR